MKPEENVTLEDVTPMVPVTPDFYLRSALGLTCCLSIIGSLAVILTYLVFKSLRTNARLVLVHLSVMDMGVGLANLVGISVNFDHYYFPNASNYNTLGLPPELKNVSLALRYSCLAQAIAADYFTLGSFLWTLSMAVYLYLKIVHNQLPGAAKRSLYVCTAVSYLLPVGTVLWKGLTKRLGYSPFTSEGWCGDKLIDLSTGQTYILMDFIGYQVWILLIFVIVPVLYVSVLFFIHREIKRTQSLLGMTSEWYQTALQNLDYKLLLIPVAFLLLRIWSLIEVLIYVYFQSTLPSTWHSVFTYLSGIGDSGQGFVNAILFIALTKKVRRKLFPCCKRSLRLEDSLINESLLRESTKRYGLQDKEDSKLPLFSPMSSRSK